MQYSIIKNILFATICICAVMIWGCAKQQCTPDFKYAGYKTKCIYQEAFTDLDKEWFSEGSGSIHITTDHRLAIQPDSVDKGFVLWTEREFKGDFQVEYTIDFPESSGVHLIFLCAQGTDNKDLIHDMPKRNGMLNEYTNELMENYYISCHTYQEDGSHIEKSTIRKNPRRLLLSQTSSDPCRDARRYLIDVIKMGGRILFFVDGLLIQDVMDKGGFGPVYDKGHLGFWFQGNQTIYIDGLSVYQLKPE